MTRRRLLLPLALILAGLVVAGVVRWARLPRPGITEANCARIKAGMTLEEVEAILGGPPQHSFIAHREIHGAAWLSDEGAACVNFDPDGVVVRAQFVYADRPPLLQRLRHRLFP